jgi:exopolyphosphatase/guanosine-5'-triphosphate,3'-diphosphate pyrophosphatase
MAFGKPKQMKLAAIDLGSNSFHAVVVDVSASGGFEVIDREKDMVRLGAETLASGRLSAAATKRGLEVLHKYRRIAANHRVDKILAVATSAIREAGNGEDFLDRVGREVGFWPRVASGEEEGRLVYLAALHSVHLEGRALVLDIGGGSVELVQGTGNRVERVASARLGSLRMTERFVRSDPISSKDEGRLVAHVEETLGAEIEDARDAGFERLVGTSGTILSVGALALDLAGQRPKETLHHVAVTREAIHEVRRRLVGSDLKERLRMAGLVERADIVVAGAVVLDEIVQRLGAPELVLCEWALREGLLLNYIHRHPRSLARAQAYPDVRRRSVQHLGERCQFDEAHARHVAALSLQLFDALQQDHGLPPEARGLLESAALLHDIGHHISYPGHHKHTYYLVKNGDLRGFSPLEVETIALVARYHRRGHPRKRHAAFGALPKRERRLVRVLAGMLRVADALDRSHRQVVKTLRVSERDGVLKLRGEAFGNSDLERWGVGRRTELLAHALGRPLRAEVVPAAAPLRRARA